MGSTYSRRLVTEAGDVVEVEVDDEGGLTLTLGNEEESYRLELLNVEARTLGARLMSSATYASRLRRRRAG